MARFIGFGALPLITVAATNTAFRLSDVSIRTTEFEVYPATNAAYIGGPDVKSTHAAGVPAYVPRAAGAAVTFVCLDAKGEPVEFDLKDVWYAGTAGGTIAVQYRKKIE
jgi:hypothetical protein